MPEILLKPTKSSGETVVVRWSQVEYLEPGDVLEKPGAALHHGTFVHFTSGHILGVKESIEEIVQGVLTAEQQLVAFEIQKQQAIIHTNDIPPGKVIPLRPPGISDGDWRKFTK